MRSSENEVTTAWHPERVEPLRARDHAQGSPDAPVTLVVYTDFQCLHCARVYAMLKDLLSELPGMFRLVFRHFPLTAEHPHAGMAAKAAEAAARQGHFWAMHDTLFANQSFLDAGVLRLYASRLGLDLEQFDRDLADADLAARIERDVVAGRARGVRGTPTLFLNGRMSRDPWDLRALRAAIVAAAGETSSA